MLDQLLDAAVSAVEMAKDAGADEAWAGAERGRSVELGYRDGALEKVQESTSRGLNLRLYVDGRYSAHSTTDLRPEQLKGFVAEAVAMTRALQPDPFRAIPDPSLFEGRSEVDLQLVDTSLAGMTQDERLAMCAAIDGPARAHEKVISATSGLYDGHNHSAAASSNGFRGTHEGTSLWIGTEVSVQDEGDKRPQDWYWVGARHKADLPSPEEIGRLCLERTLSRLGSKKGPTQKTTMVVEPRSAGRLIGQLLGPANARSVQQGQSFWADKLGQAVASKALTVVDDPLMPRGFGSQPFDGEGIALKPMPIIEAGVAKNLYVDTYYGKKAELAVTHGGATNRLVKPGALDLGAHMKAVGEGILVTSWLGGNSDSTTGDFSLGVAGFLIEGGQVGAPVGEMNITGNLVDLFMRLVAVGSDHWTYSSTQTPTLVFEGVQFSGA